MPHLDMLHPARRLWRGDDEGCRLTTLEQSLCGHVREGDVPGFEIPSRYFHYVRSGDARPLEAVLEHNRLDLISLACVTARAALLLDEGPAAARGAREALGLGRLYERGGRLGEARACYLRACALDAHAVPTRAEALRAYALISRRLRGYEDAAAAWRQMLELPSLPAAIVRDATEALAVHHEHRVPDLPQARALTLRSLTCQGTAARQQALEHRLARLERKLGDDNAAALF
jgi:tetratricopeptide (TPR) repeat protein